MEAMARYDSKMIRDFLDHLLVDVRASLQEAQAVDPAKDVGDDVSKQLKRFMKKYGTTLIPVTVVEQTPDAEAVVKATRARDQQELQEIVESLERLRPLFDLAIKCIESPDQLVVREVPLFVLADERISWTTR